MPAQQVEPDIVYPTFFTPSSPDLSLLDQKSVRVCRGAAALRPYGGLGSNDAHLTGHEPGKQGIAEFGKGARFNIIRNNLINHGFNNRGKFI